jgi:hypothetical protein
MRRQGVRGGVAAAAATPARLPVDENAGVAAATRSTPRGPLALRPVNVGTQGMMTSPVWKALPAKPATTPRPRKLIRRSPGSVRAPAPRAHAAIRREVVALSRGRCVRGAGARKRARKRANERAHLLPARQEPRRDVGRVHGGGGGSCHFCRRSSSKKWGFSGVLASEQCAEGKTHVFHLGCLAVSFPHQLVRSMPAARSGGAAPGARRRGAPAAFTN